MGSIFFIYGLVIGSFLNVCAYRILKGESVVFPQSHCTECSSKIKFYDLIPVISYIILRGRCRKCKNKISIRYPLVELITGIVCFFIYRTYGVSFFSFKYIIMTALLIVISLIDYDTQEVYSVTTYPGIFAGILLSVIGEYCFKDNIINYLIGLLLLITIIGSIVIITRGRGMGEGDIEISAICGVFLGWQIALAGLFLSFIFGSIYSLTAIILNRKKRSEPIAFGPFLFLGAIIALFYGKKIVEVYINYILI